MEAPGVIRRMAGLAIVSVVALSGCSDATHPTASTSTSFASGTCGAISEWGKRIVDRANAFTDISPHLSTTGRRTRYLFAFDEQQRVTEALREELRTAPPNGVDDADAIRARLLQAVDDVSKNIDDQKADAAAHVDFSFLGPRPDRLFSGTEKSLSLMLKPLDELGRDHRVDALGGSCGR